MLDKEGFAKAVRVKRAELGMSQGCLMAKSGVSRVTISHIENGDGRVSEESARAAEALGIKLSDYIVL